MCCSPAAENAQETLSTLRFGDRSQRIRNAPTANIFRSAKELELLLAKAEQALAAAEQQALALAAENDQLHALLQVCQAQHMHARAHLPHIRGYACAHYMHKYRTHARARHTLARHWSAPHLEHEDP